MDKTVVYSNSRNTIRTDLSLLLECLKFQMKCPDLQKQALIAILSICEKREDTVDMLREMGGVAFVYNLSKSSIVHSDVKEAALFTLGTLADANVYCKNSLCRMETFADIAGWLTKDDIPLTLRRVSVYLLSTLVVNNKLGQTLAQTTGCLDILLDLFRTTFPLSSDATLRAANPTPNSQLWASVSSALCGCVNNPQNEEGQRICVAAFPAIKIWLRQIAVPRTDIFQPICSFIAMTVANNSCVQESFSASGGLHALALALVHQTSAADTSLLSCQLSVTIAKTLSACITDNASLASGLAQYGVVSHLFSLLASPYMDPEERLSVLLTLGNCTETCEEHQFQVVQCGGLPLIITLLTEDTSEEVRKAATFILQTCKQATMSLGVSGLTARQGEGENLEPLMEGFRSSATELLHRIDLLERRQAKAENEQEDAGPSPSAEGLGQSSVKAEGDNNIELQTVRNVINSKNDSELKNRGPSLNVQEGKAEASGGDAWCSVCQGTRALMSFCPQTLEGSRGPHTTDNQLKPPAPVRHSSPKDIKNTDEKGLNDHEMSKVEKIPVEEHSFSHIRCAGCVLPFEMVTSRTFASLQSSCHHSCDMHKVLQEATEQFRARQCNLQFRREYQDNIVEHTNPDYGTVSLPERRWKNMGDVWLTPVHKGTGRGKRSLPEHHCNKHSGPGLLPLKRSHLPEGKRKDFSHDEVRYLLRRVKTRGFSRNSPANLHAPL